MRNRRKGPLVLLLFLVAALAGCDPYEQLLKKQGYTKLKTPRAEFGTGTIFRHQGNQELLVAGCDECFPGLNIVANPIVLLNSSMEQTLDVGAAATYTPASPSKLGGAFGFKRVTKLDVTFGRTTGNDLTLESLARNLEGRKVKKSCLAYLRDKRNLIVFGAPRAEQMSYTVHGEKDVNAKFDAGLLKSVLEANGWVKYTTNSTDTLSVTQPMYVAYKAFRFEDLGLDVPERSDAEVVLERGKFRLKQAR